MSVTGKRGAGIPIVLLHDATGGIITIELKNGSKYRGMLEDAQDNMNCLLRVCFLLKLISVIFVDMSLKCFVGRDSHKP